MKTPTLPPSPVPQEEKQARPKAQNREADAPRHARRRWVWAVLGAGAVGAAIALYVQPWATAPLIVATEQAEFAPVTRVLAVNGRIAARHSVDVRALVGGALVDLRVSEGDRVEFQAELARLDSAAQQAQVRQALAGLDASLVALEQARATFERSQALGDLVTRTALNAAARALDTADQDVARATAVFDQAQAQLAAYSIRAPMAGTILALHVEPGQTIDPSTILMTVADLGQLIVQTDVDEAYAVHIRPDLPAVLQLTGEADRRDGRVSRVSQRVDAATGGLAVDIAFDAPVQAPVGVTVTANIITEVRDVALTVPRAALQGDEGAQAIFVIVGGVARRRPVSVIDWPAARLIVTDGLIAGDVVILDASGINDGQSVRADSP